MIKWSTNPCPAIQTTSFDLCLLPSAPRASPWTFWRAWDQRSSCGCFLGNQPSFWVSSKISLPSVAEMKDETTSNMYNFRIRYKHRNCWTNHNFFHVKKWYPLQPARWKSAISNLKRTFHDWIEPLWYSHVPCLLHVPKRSPLQPGKAQPEEQRDEALTVETCHGALPDGFGYPCWGHNNGIIYNHTIT